MHLLDYNRDREGELVLRFAWLPYWLGANLRLRAKINQAIVETLPKGTKVRDMGEGLWSMLDDAIINTITAEYPKILGLEEFLRGMLGIRFKGKDPSDPPKETT